MPSRVSNSGSIVGYVNDNCSYYYDPVDAQVRNSSESRNDVSYPKIALAMFCFLLLIAFSLTVIVFSTETKETKLKIYDDVYFKIEKGVYTKETQILERVRFQASYSNDTNTTETKRKVILTLTLLEKEDIGKCSQKYLQFFDTHCDFTTNKSRFFEADAVIFREDDLSMDPFPERNNTNQIWIFNQPKPKQFQSRPFFQHSNVFNLTATYSFASHLPMLPMYLREGRSQEQKGKSRNYAKVDVTRNIVKVAVYNKNCTEREIFQKKYQELISALEKGGEITVDWYGGCEDSESECFNLTSAQCYQHISQLYKFALASEISDADYISERFFDPLNNTIIPIVVGNITKAKYEAISPKHSFIYVLERDVNHLKNLLKQLNAQDEKLEKYLEWNNNNYFKSFNRWYCQVCAMLFRASNSSTSVDDINKWI